MQKDLKRRSNVSSSRKRMISVAKCCRCFFQKNSAKTLTLLAVLHVAYLEELAKCDVIQSIRTVKHNTLFSYSFGQILSSFSLSCSRWTLGCASQMQLQSSKQSPAAKMISKNQLNIDKVVSLNNLKTTVNYLLNQCVVSDNITQYTQLTDKSVSKVLEAMCEHQFVLYAEM